MSCSKIKDAYCSRCGPVGAKHFDRGTQPSTARSQTEERRALRTEFFVAKSARKYNKTPKASRRLIDDDTT